MTDSEIKGNPSSSPTNSEQVNNSISEGSPSGGTKDLASRIDGGGRGSHRNRSRESRYREGSSGDRYRGSSRDDRRRSRSREDRYRDRSRESRYHDRSGEDPSKRSRRERRSDRDRYDYDRSRSHRSHRDDKDEDRRRGRYSPRRDDRNRRERSPRVSREDRTADRDRRTVFVQQLAARLRTRDLISFFEKAGPVKDASIVKDRLTNRSKGVAYVEFKYAETVPKAVAMTGERLLGIPVIVNLTEAEKNRQALAAQKLEIADVTTTCTIAVGNVPYNAKEAEMGDLFKEFGEIQKVVFEQNLEGRFSGTVVIRFDSNTAARAAVDKMHKSDMRGRYLRVTLRREVVEPESQVEESEINNGDRTVEKDASEQNEEQNEDDKHNNGYSRHELMKKLMREEDSSDKTDEIDSATRAGHLPQRQSTRCMLLTNMFDPEEESGDDWIQELEEDVKAECEEKYGPVDHISVDRNSKGVVYVKFRNLEDAQKAIDGLDGRFFDKKRVSAKPMVEMAYTLKFPKSNT